MAYGSNIRGNMIYIQEKYFSYMNEKGGKLLLINITLLLVIVI